MAIIRPFKALRPSDILAPEVASVPYDVVSTKEARKLAGENKLSFLRITRSEIEFPDNQNPYDEVIYEKAKENLLSIAKEGQFQYDKDEHFYFYVIEEEERAQVGIGATFSVDEYENNIILKHEKTRKVKEDDRTNHIITTSAQTGVVYLTYRPIDKISSIAEKVLSEVEPSVTISRGKWDEKEIHKIYIIPTEYNTEIIGAIGSVEKLYIADGHHRAASAARARAVMKKNNPNHTGTEEYNYFIAVLFPSDHVRIAPYNRLVKDTRNWEEMPLLKELLKNFYVTDLGETVMPEAPRIISMYMKHIWYHIYINEGFLENGKVKGATTLAEDLDVSILQNYILAPLFGIEDPTTDPNIDFVGGGYDAISKLQKAVDWGGPYDIAFFMFAVSIDQLLAIADAGEIMPPKSTWFEPKLLDGLLIHTYNNIFE